MKFIICLSSHVAQQNVRPNLWDAGCDERCFFVGCKTSRAPRYTNLVHCFGFFAVVITIVSRGQGFEFRHECITWLNY